MPSSPTPGTPTPICSRTSMPTWPSPIDQRLGTPDTPAIRSTRATHFVASLVRFRYGLPGCSPPCTDRTGTPQPSGTFTSRLSTDRSPSPSLDMTTTVAGSPSVGGTCTRLYEGLACQDVFSRTTFLLFVSFKGSSRGRSSALMARRPLCLAALGGQAPEPGGSRRKARGVDGESACRATMVSGHYAATRSAFLLILFPVEGFPIAFIQIDPRRSHVRYATLAASTYIRSGQTRTKVPLATVRGHRAPREDGTLLESGHIAATWVHGHTSNLGISNVPFVSIRRF